MTCADSTPSAHCRLQSASSTKCSPPTHKMGLLFPHNFVNLNKWLNSIKFSNILERAYRKNREKSRTNYVFNAVCLYIGTISYAIYAMHFLIIGSLSSWLFLAFQGPIGYIPAFLVVFLSTLPVTIITAHLVTLHIWLVKKL